MILLVVAAVSVVLAGYGPPTCTDFSSSASSPSHSSCGCQVTIGTCTDGGTFNGAASPAECTVGSSPTETICSQSTTVRPCECCVGKGGTPLSDEQCCTGLTINCAGKCDDPGCNDGNGCTDDTCVMAGGIGCVHTPNCDDGQSCTTDSCVSNSCQHTPLPCNDGNPCTNDIGNQCMGCSTTPVGVPCNDNDDCTSDSGDTCTGCTFTGISGPACNDNDPCTSDTGFQCLNNCVFTNIGGSCNDYDPCTTDLGDSCHGCSHIPVGSPCNDNNPCTSDTGDTCHANCVFTPTNGAPCNDNNPCTTDSGFVCTGCTFTPNNAATCTDGNTCTTDVCSGGQCVSTGQGPNDCGDCAADVECNTCTVSGLCPVNTYEINTNEPGTYCLSYGGHALSVGATGLSTCPQISRVAGTPGFMPFTPQGPCHATVDGNGHLTHADSQGSNPSFSFDQCGTFQITVGGGYYRKRQPSSSISTTAVSSGVFQTTPCSDPLNNDCVVRANCTDVVAAPGYTCTCPPGFTGNGFLPGSSDAPNTNFDCIDVDECRGVNTCDPVSEICQNDAPGFHCDCKEGFIANSTID